MKKRISLTLILIAIACIAFFALPARVDAAGAVWDGSVSSSFAGGSGTKSDPYLISNGMQLAAMKSNSYYELTADIYLNDTANWATWETKAPANIWTPGSYNNLYLDGNKHKIYGLYTNSSSEQSALISWLNGGYVKNLSVEKSLVQGTDYCAGIVGSLKSGTIENCIFAGKLNVAGYGNGGICGDANGDSTIISNCTNKGTCINSLVNEEDAYRFAGIAGQARNGATISGCRNEGSIISFAIQTGGIVGHAYTNVTIENCTNTGDVVVTGSPDYMSNIGGIAGGLYEKVTLKNCTNSGNVSSYSRVAGIAGSVGTECKVLDSINYGNISASSYQNGGVAGGIFEKAIVDRCINYGDVTVTSDEDCQGGIAGFANNSSIKNSINFGNVTAANCYRVGGILGNGYGLNEGVFNCYNAGRIEGGDDVGGIIGAAWESYAIQGVLQAGNVFGNDPDLVIGRDDDTLTVMTGWYNSDLEQLSGMKNWIGSFEPVSESALKSSAFIDTINNWLATNQTKLTGFCKWTLGDTSTFGYPKMMGELLPVVRKANEYRIDSLTVSDSNGKSLTSIPSKKMLVTIGLTKLIDIDDTVVFLAGYSGEGRMESLMWVKVENLSQNGSLKVTLPVDNTLGDIASLKVFTIGGFDDPTPLGAAVAFPN